MHKPTPLLSKKTSSIKGTIEVPGDKSISHRSLMLASQAIGKSKIMGLLEGEDVIATAGALRKMGVDIFKDKQGIWEVFGVGVGGLSKPDSELDMGNAGTGVRLMMGLVSSYKFPVTFTGDASLKSRPMARVTVPLEKMGASFDSKVGCRLPITFKGNPAPMPINYELPVASAQVKSAILLAGLNCPGTTSVIETIPTRDHTELMLKGFGADIKSEKLDNGSVKISITGYPKLKAMDIKVPGDPSSAAFPIVAALITNDSELIVKNICMNPNRIGLFITLKEMGANISFINERIEAGDKVADIVVKSSKLKGVVVPPERAPSMIDEYPILSIAASFAEGETFMQNLSELRVKESDRLSAIANGLKLCGVQIEEGSDYLKVKGGKVDGGATIKTHMDHRIAMSFLVMGMASNEPINVDDGKMIDTSFPEFKNLMNNIGAIIN